LKKDEIIKQEEGDENGILNANTNDKLGNLHSPRQIGTTAVGAAAEVEEPPSSFEAKIQKTNLSICKPCRSSPVWCLQVGRPLHKALQRAAFSSSLTQLLWGHLAFF